MQPSSGLVAPADMTCQNPNRTRPRDNQDAHRRNQLPTKLSLPLARHLLCFCPFALRIPPVVVANASNPGSILLSRCTRVGESLTLLVDPRALGLST